MRCWLRSSTRFNAKPVQPPQAGHSALGTGWLRIIARSALSASAAKTWKTSLPADETVSIFSVIDSNPTFRCSS